MMLLSVRNIWTCFSLLLTLSLVSTVANGKIIESALDSFNGMGREGSISLVDSPVRAGTHAFRHNRGGGRRSEFAGDRVKVNGTYWYGYSIHHPQVSGNGDGIVAQWFIGGRDASSWPCGGAGHKITMDGDLMFHLQASSSGGAGISCKRMKLLSWAEMEGKWVDIIVNAKWTANTDGFIKIWTRAGGDQGKWELKVDHKGRSQANGGNGPYFKFGIYAGSTSVIYTDEYRLGDETSSFEEVAPGQKGTPGPSLSHTLQLNAGWNLISTPLTPADQDIADVLAPINGSYEAVHSWDGTNYGNYYPGDTSSTLTKVEPGRGYWIYMNKAGSLEIKGSQASKSISLISGWNLVGYNSTTGLSAAQALSSVAGKVEAIYSFNTAANTYEDVTTFQPGAGYWLYSSESTNWTLP
jgi:hypothetical protein